MGTTRVVSCDSLYRLLSNNELLAAFAKAGFISPGTLEAKKELLLVFIDAMRNVSIYCQFTCLNRRYLIKNATRDMFGIALIP